MCRMSHSACLFSPSRLTVVKELKSWAFFEIQPINFVPTPKKKVKSTKPQNAKVSCSLHHSLYLQTPNKDCADPVYFKA